MDARKENFLSTWVEVLRETTRPQLQSVPIKEQCLFSKYFSEKLATFDRRSRMIAEKRISDILFEIEMNSHNTKKKVKKKVVHLYSALITTSQRRFTMINLPPADWKHIQAQIAAASKQSMHAEPSARTCSPRTFCWHIHVSFLFKRWILRTEHSRQWRNSFLLI